MPVPPHQEVAAALSRVWNRPVDVVPGTQIEPWSVARYGVVGGPHGSVIVKWVRDGDPADPAQRAHPSQLITETISLQFLESIGVHAPRVLAATMNLLILEDFGTHRALDTVIIEDGYGPEVRAQLAKAAGALGERHAATSGRGAEYYSRFNDVRPVDPDRELRRCLGQGWERTTAWAAEVGCDPGPAAVREAQQVRRALIEPGPFLALSNGDSATNNVLVGEDSVLIIDYEFAGFRHCLSDLVDFYLPGPRFVSVADAVESGFEDAYREALAARVPEVTDDRRYGTDLAAAGLTHAFVCLARFPVLDRRPPGESSRLQRLNVLERAADLAESHRAFPWLVEWCRTLAAMLRHRWPDTDIRTDQLPAFLPRT